MKIKLVRIGNSRGIIIPAKILRYINQNMTKNGEINEFEVEVSNSLIVTPAIRRQ